ncbi:MAG: carboxylating nicotinate-nucleotide diphosphorylase [Gammaproteobacteria bacterium]|nr:carboxylating nicotinate-nucleotide diphosphorylase [Gammaproteobacteria bacterium]
MPQVPQQLVQQQAQLALQEDIGNGDVTARLLDQHQLADARVISREQGVICGTAWFDEVFRQLDPGIRIDWSVQDSDTVDANQLLCRLHGPTHALLTGERAALNFLQTLSGTATVTQRYVQAMGSSRTRLLDTRKTIPGLRLAQKYAVTCGGGHNHRSGLYDMVLIKENHVTSCGSITAAVHAAMQQFPDLPIEVEVESLEELHQAIDAGAHRILLDNFAVADLHQAVVLTAGRAELEISGNVTLDNIAELAAIGVDYISTGAITKHVTALDLSMRVTAIENEPA